MLKAAAIVGFGALEGFWFYRCGILVPDAILRQMQFRSFVVLKVFLTAVGTSMLAQSVESIQDPDAFNKTRKYSLTAPGYLRAVGGCGLLGIGMAMAGSGPTLIPAQLMSLTNGYMVVAGALAGGAVFALIEPMLFTKDITCKLGNHCIDTSLKLPYATVAIPMGLAMIGGAFATESYFPHASDIVGSRLPEASNFLFNPITAGAVIGLNQLPLRIMFGHGQGGSTSVMSILSMATGGLLAPKQMVDSVSKAGQLLYVWVGTAVGAFIASQMLPAPVYSNPTTAFDSASVFIGSALMLLGGRIANGCTCGHGITGTSELSFQSMAAAAAIFGGGIVFAALFRS